MKALSFISLCFFAVGLSLAQTASPGQSPHGLVIIRLSLSRELVRTQPGLPQQGDVAASVRREDPNADPVDKLRKPSPVPSPSPGAGKSPYSYIYSLKVKNVGEKEVRSVLWEYVAADLDSGAELNRRRFTTIEDVGRGKEATRASTVDGSSSVSSFQFSKILKPAAASALGSRRSIGRYSSPEIDCGTVQ